MSIANVLHLGLRWIDDHAGGLERYQHGLAISQLSGKLEQARSNDTDNVSPAFHSIEAWVQSKSEIKLSRVPYAVSSYASPTETRTMKRRKLSRLARARFAKPDFIFASHHASVTGAILSLAKRVPHVVHFHGPWHAESIAEGASSFKSYLQFREEIRVYSSAQKIIALSHAFADLLVKKFKIDPDRVHVVRGGIDCTSARCYLSRCDARKQLGWPLDKTIAICVRRLIRRVGVDTLVNALELLRRKSPQLLDGFQLKIGGQGPLLADLQRQVRDLELNDIVQFLGFIPDSNLSLSYRAADFSVVPTQSLEGFGLVTLESLATGTPCLATPVGGLTEVLQPLDADLLFSSASAEDMAAKLHDILKNGGLPNEHRCIEYARRNFDWSVIAPQVMDIYRQASENFK